MNRYDYEDCLLPAATFREMYLNGLRDRPMIYVAAFYTANPAHGMAEAMRVWPTLIDHGWIPLIPHTSFLLDVLHPNDAEFWYEYDLAILKHCDALYICDDERTDASTGVAREVDYARSIGMPIYRGVASLER